MGKIKSIKPRNAWVPSVAVLAIASEISGIYNITKQFADAAKVALMERLWQARQELKSDKEFDCFISDYTPLDPKQAAQYAVAWEGARKNRKLRELATDAPDQAMAFINKLFDGNVLDTVVADDAEVARLLCMPPKKQHKALRDLIDHKKAVAEGHNPADKEQIKVLTTERDQAVAQLKKVSKVTNIADTPQAQITALAKQITDCSTALAQIGDTLTTVAGDTNKDMIATASDLVINQAERLSSLALSQK